MRSGGGVWGSGVGGLGIRGIPGENGGKVDDVEGFEEEADTS